MTPRRAAPSARRRRPERRIVRTNRRARGWVLGVSSALAIGTGTVLTAEGDHDDTGRKIVNGSLPVVGAVLAAAGPSPPRRVASRWPGSGGPTQAVQEGRWNDRSGGSSLDRATTTHRPRPRRSPVTPHSRATPVARPTLERTRRPFGSFRLFRRPRLAILAAIHPCRPSATFSPS
jgi:hypothetical protein